MGLNPQKIYLDACIVIYLIEDHPVFGEAVRNAILSNTGKQFCISPLVELECLVIPIRTNDTDLINRYERFFRKYLSLVLTPEIYRAAAEIRAKHRFKTPDALHSAAARFHGCGEIWTNDDRLKGIDGLTAVNILASVRSQK